MFYKKAIFLLIGVIFCVFLMRVLTGLIHQRKPIKKQEIPMQLVLPQPDVLEVLPQKQDVPEKRYFSKVNFNAVQAQTQTKKKKSSLTVKNIQKALKNAGFDPGAVDGKLGPKTKQAIKLFQKKHDLKVDGMVGPQTWGVLIKYKEQEQ